MNKLNKTKKLVKTSVVALGALFLVACSNTPAEPEPIEELNWEAKLSEDDFHAVRAEREEYYIDLFEAGESPELKNMDDTHYKTLTPQQALDFVEQKKSGIIYFGWKECPYCYLLRQVLDVALGDLNQDIYIVERSDFGTNAKLQKEVYDLYDITYVPNLLVMHEGKELTRMGEQLMLETLWYPDILDWVLNMSQVVLDGPELLAEIESSQAEQDTYYEEVTGDEILSMQAEQETPDESTSDESTPDE